MDLTAMQEKTLDTIWGIDTTIGPKCEHCGKECSPVQLDDETYQQADAFGMESLTEIEQALVDGLTICEECYHKEGGI